MTWLCLFILIFFNGVLAIDLFIKGGRDRIVVGFTTTCAIGACIITTKVVSSNHFQARCT
jgi:hypothetical protein